MQTHGKYLFVGKLWLKSDAPIFHVSPTTEIEYPWRVCPKSLVVRYRSNKGFVLGVWRKNHRDWHDTVLEALHGREMKDVLITPQNVSLVKRKSGVPKG